MAWGYLQCEALGLETRVNLISLGLIQLCMANNKGMISSCWETFWYLSPLMCPLQISNQTMTLAYS